MNRQQFRREKEYGAILAIAGALLRRRLITSGELRKLRAALMKKYRPVIGSLHDRSRAIPETRNPP